MEIYSQKKNYDELLLIIQLNKKRGKYLFEGENEKELFFFFFNNKKKKKSIQYIEYY
jgi:hypothetical protein